MKDHPSLEMLFLADCNLSNHIGILEKILDGCGSLDNLGLGTNSLRSEAAVVLAEFIRSNHSIEYINLSGDNLSDNDTVLFASALKMNTNLERLNLQDNDITEEGEKTLLKALYDPTSMDSIVESNHTCMAYTYDPDEDYDELSLLEQELFMINGSGIRTQKKIREKVVLALCGVDGSLFDLSYLNDLPLGLMPRVLELVQKHTVARIETEEVDVTVLQKDALSRLLHTLRGWELPLLFKNLNTPCSNVTTGKRKRRKNRR